MLLSSLITVKFLRVYLGGVFCILQELVGVWFEINNLSFLMDLSGKALKVVADLEEALIVIDVLVLVLSREMGQLNLTRRWRLVLSHRSLFQVSKVLLQGSIYRF